MIKLLLRFLRRFYPIDILDEGQIANTSKDKPDKRDHYATGLSLDIPTKYTIPDLPPIRSQGIIGSCASHGAIGCYEIQLSKRRYLEGSELFHYYYARQMNNTYPQNTGMTIRDACKTLFNYGFAFEITWPYNVDKFNDEPSWTARAFSKLYKIKEYDKMFNISDIKSSIFNGIPIVCGIFVNTAFQKLNKSNYLYDPQTKSGGGHAVIICGYDDDKKVFIIRNSWGTRFGKDGYFEMTYDSFKKISFDWWRILIKKPSG